MIRNRDQRCIGREQERTPEPLQAVGQAGDWLSGRRGARTFPGIKNKESKKREAQSTQNQRGGKMEVVGGSRVPARDQSGRVRSRFIGRAAAEHWDVMTGRRVEADQTAATILLIIFVEHSANLVRLHPHNRILLRIEIDAPIVDLDSNQIFVELVSVTQEGLFRHKFEEAGLFRRVREVFALQDAAQFFALLEQRDGGGYGSVNRCHLGIVTVAAEQTRSAGDVSSFRSHDSTGDWRRSMRKIGAIAGRINRYLTR